MLFLKFANSYLYMKNIAILFVTTKIRAPAWLSGCSTVQANIR